MPTAEDDSADWIFEAILAFLSSPTWDAHVMNFVDEQCVIFDGAEENRFEHWDAHQAFKEHAEALLAAMMLEVGVTTDDFIEACTARRFSADVNRQAFEHLCALDDFLTFKKIMVKRNVELEIQAYEAWQRENDAGGAEPPAAGSLALPGASDEERAPVARAARDSMEVADAPHGGPGAEEAKANKAARKAEKGARLRAKATGREKQERPRAQEESEARSAEQELAQALNASLVEMEKMHRQEQMEQMELEQALAISLALEEERLRSVKEAAGRQAKEEAEAGERLAAQARTPAAEAGAPSAQKGCEGMKDGEPAAASKGEAPEAPEAPKAPSRQQPAASKAESSPAVGTVGTAAAAAADSPAQRKSDDAGRAQAAPRTLAPLGPGGRKSSSFRGAPLRELERRVDEKRRATERALADSEKRKEEQRKREEALRRDAQLSEAEMASRAAYLRAQRDRIVARKREEREAAAKRYEAAQPAPAPRPRAPAAEAKDSAGAREDASESKREDAKRNAMRLALARRMKQDLLEDEEARLVEQHLRQIDDLDRKLREVEHLRSENRRKEDELARLVARQQAQRARAIRTSAVRNQAAASAEDAW